MKGAVKGTETNWTVVLRDQICDTRSFSFRDGDGLSEKKIEIHNTKKNIKTNQNPKHVQIECQQVEK